MHVQGDIKDIDIDTQERGHLKQRMLAEVSDSAYLARRFNKLEGFSALESPCSCCMSPPYANPCTGHRETEPRGPSSHVDRKDLA